MDSESKFWVFFWVIAGATVVAVSMIIAVAAMESGMQSHKRAMSCIEQGGTWIGVAGTCVSGKR
jgi:hypothetical protein